MTKTVVCLDIGGTYIKSAISTAPGELSEQNRRPMPVASWHDFTASVADLLRQLPVAANSAVAISTAGVVDSESGSVFASNIPAFHHRRVAAELSTLLHRQVAVANDADCFTLAEASVGSGRGISLVFGAILGSGVGGGLVIDGRIIQGLGGLSGEWGHGPITRTELYLAGEVVALPRLPCGCGQVGCLDTLGGARGLERLHQLLHQQALSSQTIVSQWHAGEATASRTIEGWSQLVSEPLALAINLLGPGRVTVGGGLASDQALIALLDDQVRKRILRRSRTPLVVAGEHSELGGLIGASVLGHRLG